MAVAMDAMAVAIHIKYALSQNIHLIFYYRYFHRVIYFRFLSEFHFRSDFYIRDSGENTSSRVHDLKTMEEVDST